MNRPANLRTFTPGAAASPQIAFRSANALSAISKSLLFASALLSLLIFVHLFFRFIGRAPYFAVDDSLANISVVLSNRGQYGFPASPIQAMSDELRLQSFVNYGPWPFAIGAALDWLFGTSYTIQRSVNLFSLGIPILAFFLAFRRVSMAAVGVFVAVWLTVFWRATWPMFRPDFAVCMFGAIAIASFTLALRTGSLKGWFIGGFAGASAATTHPIALALLPWMLLLWACTHIFFRTGSRTPVRPFRSFLSLCIGIGLGIFIYLAAVKFRVDEVIHLWTAGQKFLEAVTSEPYSAIFLKHLRLAWGGVGQLSLAIGAGFGIALIVTTLTLSPRMPWRHALWALLAPPVSLGLAYQLSLGFYGNFHSGYALLSQVATTWGAAAVFATPALAAEAAGRPTLRQAYEIVVRTAAAASLIFMAGDLSRRPDRWAAVAATQVDFDDYLRKAIEVLPEGASAWGGILFGLESGARVNLIQLGEGVALLNDFKPERRDELAPDYLVLNDNLRDVTFGFVRARSLGQRESFRNVLDAIPAVLPKTTFGLVAIVDAPPYGSTRIYGRNASATLARPPLLAANNGSSPQWARSLGENVGVEAEPVAPADFQLTFAGTAHAAADRTAAVRLPAGTYLLTVEIRGGASDRVGLITAASTPNFSGAAGDLGFAMAQAPYFPGEKTVYLLIRHTGGRVYVSQFDASETAAFTVREARPVVDLSPAETASELATPPLSQWRTFGAGSTATGTADRAHVISLAGGASYQISSPPIQVEPQSMLRLNFDLEPLSGRVALGVLDERGYWLVTPELSRSSFEFQTGQNRAITLVVSGMEASQRSDPLEFTLSNLALKKKRQTGDYARRLAACRLQDQNSRDWCLRQPVRP